MRKLRKKLSTVLNTCKLWLTMSQSVLSYTHHQSTQLTDLLTISSCNSFMLLILARSLLFRSSLTESTVALRRTNSLKASLMQMSICSKMNKIAQKLLWRTSLTTSIGENTGVMRAPWPLPLAPKESNISLSSMSRRLVKIKKNTLLKLFP